MKKFLLLFIIIFTLATLTVLSQPLIVNGLTVTGKLNQCNASFGSPVVTITRVGGAGSFVNAAGALACSNQCDSTVLSISLSNLHWNKGPDNNWIHGVFFPTGGSTGITLTGNSLPPANWIYSPTGCTGTCPPQGPVFNPRYVGGPGFYFAGPGQSCCPGGGATPTVACDNYGDPTFQCGTPFALSFEVRICNDKLTGANQFIRLFVTSDGNTGCWTQEDVTFNSLLFQFSTQACASPLYSPAVASTVIPVKTCSPTLNYTATFTGGCGNGSTIQWYDAAIGGNLVGTGSPFVYDPPGSACPGGITLYGSCCPTGTTCFSRKAATVQPCPAALVIDSIYHTDPTCTNASASIDSIHFSNAAGSVTYTLNPGNITNSTGVFPGLTAGTLYIVTISDGGSCVASKNITFTAPTNCCGPAPVAQGPVTYCQSATTATALTATGTALLWYTSATSGVGSTTAPTPSTTTAGTFTFYVSQTVGGCESPRAAIVVTITASATITLSSAATTNNQTVCINAAISTITYATANGTTGATVSGLPAGITGTFNAGTGIVTISGTPTVTGMFTYNVTTTGGCNPPTTTGVIIVNPIATIALTSAAATTNQTVCLNTAISNITYNIGGGATNATVTGLPAGVVGTYSAGTFIISGTPTATGTFNYTVSTSGGCAVATSLGSITVTANATITLTSAAATTTQTVCANTAITNIIYTTGNGVTGVTVTGLPAGLTGNFTGSTFTISGSPTVTGLFNYTVTTTGGCSTATLNGTLTVTPGAATITLSSAASTTSQTICINTAITNIIYVTGGGASGGTVTGLPTGVTGTFASGTITISGTPSLAGVFNYTASTTGSGGCGSPTQTGTITVNNNSTINLTSTAASAVQTVCVNTAINSINYSTANGVTGVTASGLPVGVTGNFAGGNFTITGTPTAAGTFSYTVTTTGGCSTASLTGTITVNAISTISLSSAATTTSQTVCVNTAITNIIYNAGGGATNVTVTGLPSGIIGVFSSGTFTISGTPTVNGIFNYTVATTGGCGSATLSGSITVNPSMTIVLTSAAATTSQTICANIAINNIVYTLGGGATSATVTGLPTGVTGNFSGGIFTISGSPTATGTFSYTVSANGGCGTATLSGSITVTPGAASLTLSSASSTANQTVCNNNAITNITYVTGGGATGGNVTGLPTGVTGNFSAGTITISGTPTASGIFNYTVTTTGSGSCGSPSLTGTITVNANATIALSSAAGTDAQTVCINTAITPITYSSTNGVTGASVTGLPAGISGNFAGGIFTISGTPTLSGTFNYIITTSGGCTVTSASGVITVSPLSTVALTSAASTSNQTVSINTAITTITNTAGNGATNITISGLPTGVTGSFAGGILTINGSPTVVGTFPYTVTTTGGCGIATLTGTIIVNDMVTLTLSSAAGTENQSICINTALTNITYIAAGGATGASITAGTLPAGLTGNYNAGVFTISGTPTVTGTFNYTVTTSGGVGTASLSGSIVVNPNATITLNSSLPTTSQIICINTSITNIIYTAGNGGTSATVTGLPTGVTGNFAGGQFTISGTATVSGTFLYTVTTTGGCSAASLSGSIIVNPITTITLSSATATSSQTICINSPITNIIYTIGNGGTGATVTGLPSGVSGNFSSGNFVISGSSLATGTFSYIVTTSGGCSTVTATGTIIVNANVSIALSSAPATSSQNICVNTAIANITYNTNNGVTGVTVSGLPTGVTGNFSGGIFTISGSPTVAGNFTYNVTTTGGCTSATATGTMTINPTATILLTSAASTASQTVCINTAISAITYSAGNGGTGISVTGLPAGVSGNFAGGVFTINGTPTVSGTFSYTVATTGGCASGLLTGTITVNPNVTMALASAASTTNQTVCINSSLSNIVYNTTNGATNITFTGLPAGTSGNFAAGVFSISGSPIVTGTFNYTLITVGGCSSATMSGTITVNPNGTLSLTSPAATTSQTICSNTLLTDITYTTGTGATGAGVTGLPAGVTGNYAGGIFTISGIPTVAGSFAYTVSSTGGCGIASLSGTINSISIPNKPLVKSPVIYCLNDNPKPVSDSVNGNNLLWYTAAIGGTGTSGSPMPVTSIPGSTNYYVSQSNGNCESQREIIVVTVKGPIAISIGADSTICEGNIVKYFPVVNPPASVYRWRAIGVPMSTIDSVDNINATFSPVNNAQYILRAGIGGCASEDTVNVNVRWKPIVDAGNNVPICLNNSTLLSGVITHTTAGPTGISISDFVWTPKDSLSFDSALIVTAYPTKTTWYRLTVKTDSVNYGCAFTSYDSVKVVVQPIVKAFAGMDTLAVKGAPHQLQGSGGNYYQWSSPSNVTIANPDTKNPFVTLSTDANFYLKVSDAIGCTGFDSVFIKVYNGPAYYVPNAFSPNGDGQNDIFRAIPVGISNTTYFRVFNRYGEILFETNQWLKGWDGTYKGKPQPSGSYVWSVKGKDKDGKIVEIQGSVMLVR